MVFQDSNLTDAIPNPCFNKGFNYTATANEVWLSPCSKKPIVDMFPLRDNTTYTFMGTGLPEKCDRETQKLFNKTALCPHKNCTFDGVYQPQLSGNFLVSVQLKHFINTSVRNHNYFDLLFVLNIFCHGSFLRN